MNKKVLGLVLATVLATTLISIGTADQKTVAFRVEVAEVSTISLEFCETDASTIPNVLEFSGAIFYFGQNDSIADDACGNENYGDWNITSEGNVWLKLAFSLNEEPPAGLKIAVGTQYDYNSSNYVNLSTTDIFPWWASGNDSLSYGDVRQIYQRVQADTESMVGNETYEYTISITSMRDH